MGTERVNRIPGPLEGGRESLLVSTGSNGAKSIGEIFLGSIELANYFLPAKSSSSLRNHHSSLGGVRGEGLL